MVTDEEILAAYRELMAVRRVSRSLKVSEKRVCRVVAPIVEEIRALTRAMVSRRTNGEAHREMEEELLRGRWRCAECGAAAQGPECFNGHPPPWRLPRP